MLKFLALLAILMAYLYSIYRDNSNTGMDEVKMDISTQLSLNDITVTLTEEDNEQQSVILTRSEEEVMKIEFGVSNEFHGIVTSKNQHGFQVEDGDYAVRVDLQEMPKTSGCLNILWKAKRPSLTIHNCIDIKGANWYGGAEMFSQRWPIQIEPQEMSPYLSRDIISHTNMYGSVLERYFLSSDGMALFISHDTPLHVGYDNERLCLLSNESYSSTVGTSKARPNYPYYSGRPLSLNYTVCVAENVVRAHTALLGKLWKFPEEVPNSDVFKAPIWSTWAKYKMGVTEEDVKTFTMEISKHEFPASHIEVDDMYTSNYGDWEWDIVKFPNPRNLSDFVHSHGFKLITWVMPFVNSDTKSYQEGLSKGLLVGSRMGTDEGLIKWWQGTGGLVDFTDDTAISWFKEKLDVLRESGVDSFKFDAGENQYLPADFQTKQELKNPMEFVRHYVEGLRKISDDRIEVRAGYQTQHVGILVRIMDKHSVWGFDNGLKTIIPAVLHAGIIGYPFTLPDMIGGNAYSADGGFHGALPEKELFIRWLELTAFLPSMQFSITPWQYDSETTKIALKFVRLHQEFVAPRIIQLATESTQTGFPIIRPVWWVAPDDGMTFDIDSQFLIGDDVLVAPILDKGATFRDIYLPEGTWLDFKTEKYHKGPLKLKNYSIKLDKIGLFLRTPIKR